MSAREFEISFARRVGGKSNRLSRDAVVAPCPADADVSCSIRKVGMPGKGMSGARWPDVTRTRESFALAETFPV